MPDSPLPEHPAENDPWPIESAREALDRWAQRCFSQDDATTLRLAREIQMRWRCSGEDDGEPILLEVCVGGSWAAPGDGRHVVEGIVDVDLVAPDEIFEDVAAAPCGTPVVLGAGQQFIVTCCLGGALFNA